MFADETNYFGDGRAVSGKSNVDNTGEVSDEQAYISIRNLGPISECNLTVDNFTVLTGKQAAGKSTVAKCIYFCRTIKNDLFAEIMMRKNIPAIRLGAKLISGLLESVKSVILAKFLQLFGMSLSARSKMLVEYRYSADTWLRVSQKDFDNPMPDSTTIIDIEFSENIVQFIDRFNSLPGERDALQTELNNLFHDEYETIFIPAGRSLISLLNTQLNYFFATMSDEQKQSLDYCTQKYIEYTLKMRDIFANGIQALAVTRGAESAEITGEAQRIMANVLGGEYFSRNGEDYLFLTDSEGKSQYVQMKYTSSGQQESVWIFNIMFSLLTAKTKAFVIVEEPEAHLYPDAQKQIAEALALVVNSGCQMLITTHSPYILGALNNLIYAGYLSAGSAAHHADALVSKVKQIENCSAYYVSGGEIKSCLEDTPEKLIKNEVIDGASHEINQLYDSLFDISLKDTER